jgi:hypothetical protein
VSYLDGVPVVEGAVHGAGTEIRDGFVVAEGSWLVGVPFPRDVRDGGWFAVVLVTGQIHRVVRDYTRQARALGIDTGDPRCTVDSNGVSCGFGGSARARATSATIEADIYRDPRFNPRSHLLLTYTNQGTDEGKAGPGERSLQSVRYTPLPSEWPSLPDDVGDGFGFAVTLERGTRVVAPPLELGQRRYAVLAVIGDTADVLARYDRQLRASAGDWKRFRDVVITVKEGTARHVQYGTFDASFDMMFAPAVDGITFLLLEQAS